ncbi:hypothetical protein COOONC_08308 [Cooperia oncophora]
MRLENPLQRSWKKVWKKVLELNLVILKVSYYSPDNANPYTYWSPTKLDAAAGWVMRAEEVARLFALLESHKRKWYWILVQPSAAKQSYGRGGVQLGDDGSLYHIGSLAGSEAIGLFSRRHTGSHSNKHSRPRTSTTHGMDGTTLPFIRRTCLTVMSDRILSRHHFH